MKKLISILICLALLATVCGCSDDATTTESFAESSLSDSTANESNNSSSNNSSKPELENKEESTQTENNNSLESGEETKNSSAKNPISSKKPQSANNNESLKNENKVTSKPQGSGGIKNPEAGKNPAQQNAPCSHKNKIVKNQQAATCTVTGYAGDTYCKDCNAKLEIGAILSASGHINTTIKNKKSPTQTSEGYTGDIYCNDCNAKTASGTVIPKLQNNLTGKVTYTTNNGYTYKVDASVNITEYTMSLRTKKINSPYRQAELEILRLCNVERAKAGVAPLAWYEDAYYFTHVRAEEAYTLWGHTRPDGSPWHTVYTNAGVIFNCSYGENLAQFQGWTPETVAQNAVDAWMNSAGHRANILNPDFTKMALALDYGDDNLTLSAAQHFFG